MTSTVRNVLVLGIYNPDVDPQGLVLEKQKAQAREKDMALSFWLVDTINRSEEENLAQLKSKLREHVYHAVGIGLGIRGNAQWTLLFEQLVNSVIQTVPGVKLAFPRQPDDVIAAFCRVLHEP